MSEEMATSTGFSYTFDDADSFLRSLSGGSSPYEIYSSESSGADLYDAWFDDAAIKEEQNVPTKTEEATSRENLAMESYFNANAPEPAIKQEEQAETLFAESSSVSPETDTRKTHGAKGSKVTKPKKDKVSHSLIEKKYRNRLNDKFVLLRDAVPSLRAVSEGSNLDELEGLAPAAKFNKANILTKAVEYIKHLEQKNRMMMDELVHLRTLVQQPPQAVYMPPQPQYVNPVSQQYPSPQTPQMSFGNKVLLGGMTALVGSQLYQGAETGNDGFDYHGMGALPLLSKFLPIVDTPYFVPFVHVLRCVAFFGGLYALFQPLVASLVAPKKQKKTVTAKGCTLVTWEIIKLYGSKVGLLQADIKTKINQLKEINSQVNAWFDSTIMTQTPSDVFRLANWRGMFILYVKSLSLDASFLSAFKSPESIVFQFSRLILERFVFLKLGTFAKLFGISKKNDACVMNLLRDLKSFKASDDMDGASVKLVDTITKVLRLDVGFVEDEALFQEILLILNMEKINQQNTAVSQTFVSNFRGIDLNLINFSVYVKCQLMLKQVASDYLSLVAQDELEDDATKNILNTLDDIDKIIPEACSDLRQTSNVLRYLVGSEQKYLNDFFHGVTEEVAGKLDFYGYDQSLVSKEEIGDEEDDESDDSETDESTAVNSTVALKRQALDSTVLRITSSVEPTRRFRSDLASKSTIMLLTCCLCLHYNSVGDFEKVDAMLRHLKVQCSSLALGELDIFAFTAVFKLFDTLSKTKDLTASSKSSLEAMCSKLRVLVGNSASSVEEGCSQLVKNFIPKMDYQLRSEVSEKLVVLGKTLSGYA